jgi:hypothetical protein
VDTFGKDCHWDSGVTDLGERVVNLVGDVEKRRKSKSLELMWSEFTCPRVEYLEHLNVSLARDQQ